MSEKRRILVIDDEPLIRRAMADYLADCGYETVTAADGAEGLAEARAEQFHAVLVDLRMPHDEVLRAVLDREPDEGVRKRFPDRRQGGKRVDHVPHGTETDQEDAPDPFGIEHTGHPF